MPLRTILVPTDGSALSRRAAVLAAQLAAKFDAGLVSVYVVPEGVPTLFSGDKLYASPALAPRYRAALRAAADAALAGVAKVADAAGVRHSSVRAKSGAPWRSIVHAARSRKCDLIVMGTHGRRGLGMLGSQTLRAIAHTRVPVLVCR